MDKDILKISLFLLVVLLFILVLIILLIFVNKKRKKYIIEDDLDDKKEHYSNKKPQEKDLIRIEPLNKVKDDKPKKLFIVSKSLSFKNYEMVNDVITIGRGKKCDLIINDSYIGKYHSIIFYKDKSFFLADLNSKNGTYVENEKPVDGIYEIVKNTKVKIGYTEFDIIIKENN